RRRIRLVLGGNVNPAVVLRPQENLARLELEFFDLPPGNAFLLLRIRSELVFVERLREGTSRHQAEHQPGGHSTGESREHDRRFWSSGRAVSKASSGGEHGRASQRSAGQKVEAVGGNLCP